MIRSDWTWAQAMSWTHREQGVRAEEHFSTSIDIADAVARTVLRRCQQTARRHAIDDPWIVDVGSGSGRLLGQLLDLGFPGERLLGVDVRAAPDLPVHWIQGIAPQCLPEVEGVVFAHEFLDDVPADVVREGRVELVDGSLGPPATPAQRDWAARWGEGVCGVTRDEAWARVVGSVRAGEAIAVDFSGGGHVGHLRGRRTPPIPDGRDLCAGVNFRSLTARTGGRVVPQHRLFPGDPVLSDRSGLGSFLWLFAEGVGREHRHEGVSVGTHRHRSCGQ
jgi:hypothetical protein